MKKGFTLIELLAVIVILAIIALIAVPIVLNIINDSKKESQQRSTDLYMDHVQKAITKYQMTHPGFNPSTCEIIEKGKLTCDGTPIEVEMKGQTPESGTITIVDNKLYYDVTLEGKKYVLEIPPTPATGEDYRGYYADVDGDGEADGIIYADLKQIVSGQWYNSNGIYSYTAQTGLKEYTISKEKYTEGKFGEKEIISVRKGSSGTSRFYVMALEDFTDGAMTGDNSGRYYWYTNASGKMPYIVKDTKPDFGTGYKNTENMIRIWDNNGVEEGWTSGATQDNYDIWKHIKGEFAKGWYIPSKEEWAAFGDYFTNNSKVETKLTKSNYNSLYGLSSYYWSSSQYDNGGEWGVRFLRGRMDYYSVNDSGYVRLGATF